jgi:beta-lactamase class A
MNLITEANKNNQFYSERPISPVEMGEPWSIKTDKKAFSYSIPTSTTSRDNGNSS